MDFSIYDLYSWLDHKWNIKPADDINALYQHFFNENEKDKKEAMLNAEVMFNAFMPFGNKFSLSLMLINLVL